MASTQEPVGEPRIVFDSNKPVRPPIGFGWGFAEGVKATEEKYKALLEAAQEHALTHSCTWELDACTLREALRQLGEPHA